MPALSSTDVHTQKTQQNTHARYLDVAQFFEAPNTFVLLKHNGKETVPKELELAFLAIILKAQTCNLLTFLWLFLLLQ